jgi:hypothetical protein
MSDAPKPYVIEPGDTLLTIALMHDVEPEEIWEHEKNEDLAEEREQDMLAPGEILYIPPGEPPTVQVQPMTSNKFKAKLPNVTLYFEFKGETGPLADEKYEVDGLPELIEGSLDGAGKLALTVPALTQHLTIKFVDRQIEHDIALGQLDPVDRPTGVRARLLHTGHLPVGQDSFDPYVFATEESERETLAAFQKAYRLEPTGFIDEETKEALVKAHGC